MNYTYLYTETFNSENRLFKSKIDYEFLFNNLDDEIKLSIETLTDYYYEYFKNKLITFEACSIFIDPVRKIDDIPVKIKFYIVKNCIEYPPISKSSKIGMIISLNYMESVNPSIYYILQNLYFTNFEISKVDEFKNVIYNCLFYCHIILRDFKYHPMLKYLNHFTDLNELVNIQISLVNLFDNKIDCSVCLEQTISTSTCNHPLCQKCFSKLKTKVCPICRKILSDEVDDYDDEEDDSFY